MYTISSYNLCNVYVKKLLSDYTKYSLYKTSSTVIPWRKFQLKRTGIWSGSANILW